MNGDGPRGPLSVEQARELAKELRRMAAVIARLMARRRKLLKLVDEVEGQIRSAKMILRDVSERATQGVSDKGQLDSGIDL